MLLKEGPNLSDAALKQHINTPDPPSKTAKKLCVHPLKSASVCLSLPVGRQADVVVHFTFESD